MKKNISEEIYNYLLTEIRERRLTPESALPSENMLCRQFYVSRPTVRKAIARLCDGGYTQSRAGLGTFVTAGRNNVPAANPARLILGIDGVDFHDEYQYYTKISQGARRAADQCGAMLCLTDLPELMNSADRKVEAFIATRVETDEFTHAEQVEKSGTPMIFLNRYPDSPDAAFISVDFGRETFRVVNRLIQNGAKRIALIGRQTGSVATAARTRGWEEAYQANDLPVPYDLAIDFQDFHHNNTLLPDFFREKTVDVAFVTAGYQLPPVLTSLERAGKRPSEDLDILCFDDIERLCDTIDIPVSYIKMPLESMGAQAVEYLSRRIRDPKIPPVRITRPASLVVNRCKYLI